MDGLEFKDRLFRLRKERGMSQEELASRLGVSRQAVSKWETGEAQPDYAKLIALADALEISLDALCGRETPASKPEAPPPEQKLSPWLWVLAAVCLVLAVVIGVLMYRMGDSGPAADQPGSSVSEGGDSAFFPAEFAIGGAEFEYGGGELTYRFVPSAVTKGTQFRIVLDNGIKEYAFDAQLAEGGCRGTVRLPEGRYHVVVMAECGTEKRMLLIAKDLRCFDREGCSWTVVD